jgi:hypothetical protein
MVAVRRMVAAVCAAAAVAPLAACTPGGSSGPRPLPSLTFGQQSFSSALVATRWWSNSANQAGSTLDPKHPEAGAAGLSVSPTDYCGMLRQTVAAGKSILPGVTANDPALLTSTRAFLAELEAVAPPSVAGPWQVLGSAVITFVESGGDSTAVKTIDAAAVRKAASTVAADAKHSCGVDLS